MEIKQAMLRHQISSIIFAVRSGMLDRVKDALDAGADANEADSHQCSGLPLRTACFEGDLSIIKLLIEHGADVNASSIENNAGPLRLALRRENAEVAVLLVQNGADVPSDILEKTLVLIWPHGRLPAAKAILEADSIELPPLSFYQEPISNELPPLYFPGSVEQIDIAACYGVDTNVLSLEFPPIKAD